MQILHPSTERGGRFYTLGVSRLNKDTCVVFAYERCGLLSVNFTNCVWHA